ncbi:HAMP domain-containing sensor histidine kinase [Chryseolinea sp. T2]|uniref:HAMP domain-containing sensor histidine kinase n=1 Tax=Chryseolinea sp. T2 TaxID=3129255 RepID=UPI003076E66B
MDIKKKIVLYFSSGTIILLAIALVFIYTLFSRFREEEFQQRQVEKIRTTLKFLTEIRNIDQDLIEGMDRITIHDIYDEKLLIFDKSKKLVYSSIDDTPVAFSSDLLEALSADKPIIEQKDGLYDVTGIYLEKDDKAYYGISKAYDISGYSKLNYLRYVLSFTLAGICLAVVLIAYYLSSKITRSIEDVTRQINDFAVDGTNNKLVTAGTSDEVSILAQRFNELMQRMNEAFAFQKHAVHHISHELKTPIAVLVSDIERMEQEKDTERLKQMISVQKENTKSLGEIINSLLEIAKTESGNAVTTTQVRVDEMIFDLIDSFRALYPEFRFSITYSDAQVNDDNLSVRVNDRLFRSALSNLMQNCINYSQDAKAGISIATTAESLKLDFTNRGKVISEYEQAFLFRHFFRGANSRGKRGFGLGLVFISKILSLHKGTVTYAAGEGDLNTFSISLPLS